MSAPNADNTAIASPTDPSHRPLSNLETHC